MVPDVRIDNFVLYTVLLIPEETTNEPLLQFPLSNFVVPTLLDVQMDL